MLNGGNKGTSASDHSGTGLGLCAVIILQSTRPEEPSDGRDILQVSHRLKPRLPPPHCSSTSLALVHTQSVEEEMGISDF